MGKGITVGRSRTWSTTRPTSYSSTTWKFPPKISSAKRGKGFRYILDGLNAERTLIAAECIGDGYWFIDKVDKYVEQARTVFGRPIGQNQGVQFPIAKALIEYRSRQSDALQSLLAIRRAQTLRRRGQHGIAARRRIILEAANACLQFHGGFGFARDYDIERKFRETRLYQVAPISTNLILSYIGEHVLKMPRSF